MAKVYSSWWVVYHIDPKTNEPQFLVVKRFALSRKVEWIAPKGKIEPGETQEQAAIREVWEEVGLDKKYLTARKKLDTLSLQLINHVGKLGIDKDITYFLIEYTGNPDHVRIIDGEWFTGAYKRWNIINVLNLVTYRDLRELYRQAYQCIGDISVKDKFIKSL